LYRSEEDQFLALRENNSLVVNENFTLAGAIPSLLTGQTRVTNKFRVRSTHANEERKLW
jgi:hypothetical protein